MNPAVVSPREQNREELGEKVAKIHGEAVISFLKRLTCPSEQKKQILSKILDEMKSRTDPPTETGPQRKETETQNKRLR